MNQKALRQEMEFPPLLNLQEDKPRIASDFRSVEHNNSPYIDGMLMPLWKKESTFTNQPVYDYKNNRYEIKDGWLTKNDEDLFPIEDNHFEVEDVTEDFSQYLGFDFAEDGTLASMKWDSDLNQIIMTFGTNVYTSGAIFVNGTILASRVRVVKNPNTNDNFAIGVVIGESGGYHFMVYIRMAPNPSPVVTTSTGITWCQIQPKADWTAQFNQYEHYVSNPSPIIQICNPLQNVWAVSIISNYGEVLYTRDTSYFNFVEWSGTFVSGLNWKPAVGSTTETITNYLLTTFSFSNQQSSQQEALNVYKRGDTWYLVSAPDTPVPDQQSLDFNPKLVPNQTIEYQGVTYPVYQVFRFFNRCYFRVLADDPHGIAASILVHFNDGQQVNLTLVNNYAETTVSNYTWKPFTIRSTDAILTFDGTYYIEYTNRNYTVTKETTPTQTTLGYNTAPNIFLDNGNMYSLYTIPEANLSASAMPLTLQENTMVVESGKLTGWDGTYYYFNAIEAHIVDAYTIYPRSNSAAIAQNFWNSSTKYASPGVRTPYDIYVAKTAAETFTAAVKYTEYSNSNCSDMLYYAGTCPRNDQKFYKYATNNSEDVAWFNPGGFRAPLKGNWNILYYVDSTGAVGVQGISYSRDNNHMGTLVCPIQSLTKAQYIAASNDCVIYKDGHNHWYKVEVKDGAQLSSVFDRRFIVVNTTGYWNMWDEENYRKFHYATDYNNRTKLGLLRTTYRNTASWYLTESKTKTFVTAINPNYNILPRLAVTSLIPGANALAHLIMSEHYEANIYSYGTTAEESREVQAMEIYAQGNDTTNAACQYQFSLKNIGLILQIYSDPNLLGTSYSDSKAILAVADIMSKFINGAGNHDLIVENKSKYSLTYNNQNKPIFIYSLSQGIDVDNAQWFFVIQGQYYAVIADKLYAMIYSNGTISQSDAIVDIPNLYYVGSTPAVAFFVNPYTKQVYSFTGDANLQKIFDASKYHFQFTLPEKELKHWYDSSTQSIYVATDEGLLIFGPDNTYCLEDYKNVLDIEFVDGDIHIIEFGKEATLRYYHDIEDYKPEQTILETSFFGLGANEVTTIDRWQIVLYDPEHKEQDILLQVRSLTDVSTQAEEKKIHIDANGWDKYTHSALISYVPKLIKGKGIRLTVKTISAIQSIVPHVADQKTTQPTNQKFSV